MINVYSRKSDRIDGSSELIINDSTAWIDLINITSDEEKLVESMLGIEIPNRLEMAQIEISNRLYIDNEALYVTVSLAENDQEIAPNDLVTLIIYKHMLITIRYSNELKPFDYFVSKLTKSSSEYSDARLIFLAILNIMTERVADILQDVTHNINAINQEIFSTKHNNKKTLDYRNILKKIGRRGNLISRSTESLLSFSRAINFFKKSVNCNLHEEYTAKLDTMLADIHSLNEHAISLSTEVAFLLDASLGMINIEQNNIIRLCSVVPLVFLPPTLIATIYGMNFVFMPELKYWISYPISLLAMLISGWLPYKVCKEKKWL